MRVKSVPVRIKAAGEHEGTDDGVFEAIVATYDLDSVGDRIVPGAFKDTLAEWAKSGDPIPVLWSHMSHDPDYHIGYVEDAKEVDEGLWIRARLDLDEPKAAKIYKLLKGRRVTKFSFAYDIEDGELVDDAKSGEVLELRKLRLFEVGPTLVGANQATALLDIKSARVIRADNPHNTKAAVQSMHDSAVALGAICVHTDTELSDAPSGDTAKSAPESPPDPDPAEPSTPAWPSPATTALLTDLARLEGLATPPTSPPKET